MSKEPDSGKETGTKSVAPSPKKSTRKLKAAYAQIRMFFTYTEFPLMKELLHQWLLAGIENQHKWEHEDTVDLIYKTESLIDLVNSLWVLYKAELSYNEEDTSIRDNDDFLVPRFSSQVLDDLRYKPYNEIDFYTQELNKKEEENPFIVLQSIFKESRPSNIHWKIQHWRDTAMTNPWEYHAMDKVEMTKLHKDIDRLVEAAFIINEIELLREEFKDE